MSVDPSQQVVGENEETQHRCQLVTVRALVLADRDFVLCCAVVGEKEPSKPDRHVQTLWPKTTHKIKVTGHATGLHLWIPKTPSGLKMLVFAPFVRSSSFPR
jgi:hypothetical protein